MLQGELPKVTQNSFFEYDRKRYLDMLDNFKGGWSYYLSILETEIIEQKLILKNMSLANFTADNKKVTFLHFEISIFVWKRY